ncbi:hypothetical protein [Spiroplasma endosymbiont of Polydrusus pterygomalis]|uniref:hypothetical protein n=1 Tax=Spiroplasma endosymbiont of Polydrusus pterygomalis TaxID=3139327 RepID=UPI003CCB6772
MSKSSLKNSDPESEENKYIPNKKSKRFDVLSKIKVSRTLLFWTPIVQIIAAITFLILLIVDAAVGKKMGFEFTKLQLALSLSYVGVAILINIICFMIPARKLKKKSSFRITAISTLILSTLILSGSFVFWTIPVLLFFSLISLIVWICEVIAAIILILAVEELPNEK